jgi:hypothetical protein
MKIFVILSFTTFGCASCDDSANKAEPTPVSRFHEKLQKDHYVTFASWNGIHRGIDSDTRLIFRDGMRVDMEDYGYSGLVQISGNYSMDKQGRITATFEKHSYSWPTMFIGFHGRDLILSREDGVTVWPIEATHESSPDAVQAGFWPFREIRIEQGEASNP